MDMKSRESTILELGFRKEALPALERYVDLLWKTNEALNLISRKMTYDDLIDNHVIDCLLPLKYYPHDLKRAADFGSGGGLPGVIYALQFPNTEFHLFEKSNLKQEFLRMCAEISPNIKVHGEIPLELKGIELVSARAFKALDVILDMSRSYYKAQGKYFLLKGRREKINEEYLLAKKKFKDLKINIEPLKSPLLDVERHLVSIHL